MTAPRVVTWARDDDQRGHSLGRLTATPTGWTADGVEVDDVVDYAGFARRVRP